MLGVSVITVPLGATMLCSVPNEVFCGPKRRSASNPRTTSTIIPRRATVVLSFPETEREGAQRFGDFDRVLFGRLFTCAFLVINQLFHMDNTIVNRKTHEMYARRSYKRPLTHSAFV